MPNQSRYYVVTRFNSTSAAINSIDGNIMPDAWAQSYFKEYTPRCGGKRFVLVGFASGNDAMLYRLSLQNPSSKLYHFKSSPCTYSQIKRLLSAYALASRNYDALDRVTNAKSPTTPYTKTHGYISIGYGYGKVSRTDYDAVVLLMQNSLLSLQSQKQAAYSALVA
jgi:hypothetical protein